MTHIGDVLRKVAFKEGSILNVGVELANHMSPQKQSFNEGVTFKAEERIHMPFWLRR